MRVYRHPQERNEKKGKSMKHRNRLAVFGTMAAIGLSAAAFPAGAADQNTTSGSISSAANSRSTLGLGQIERANKLIGKEVMSSDNQKAGKIDNLIVDLTS